MPRPRPDIITKQEYLEGRLFAARVEDLIPGTDFKLRRPFTIGESILAITAHSPPIFCAENLTRIESVDEFKGLFAVSVHFVAEGVELKSKTRPIVNSDGIIVKLRKPHIERGYFLKNRDPLDIELENLLTSQPNREPSLT
jgi:hypothetical protein